jgi:hypothetical protein
VPDSILETYLPTGRERLANQWIHLLHLAMHVEHMIAMHYRPRRQLLSLSQLEAEGADLWKLQESAPLATDSLPATTVLHAHHLHCYFNTAVIALYRPYSLSTPAHLTPAQREQLRSVAQQRMKDAAGSTTAVINKLVALDMIELSFNMLVTTTMFAAQVHLLEIKQSEGLARQFASHNFNLHVLVLSQLRRTYWTADHQHKLFTETLKAFEECERQTQQELRSSGGANVSNNPTLTTIPVQQDQSYANEEEENLDCEGFGGSERALEDIFLSFNPNPFISLPTDFDPG